MQSADGYGDAAATRSVGMTRVTITIAGITSDFATVRAAMVALAAHLEPRERSLLWLADAVRMSANGGKRASESAAVGTNGSRVHADGD